LSFPHAQPSIELDCVTRIYKRGEFEVSALDSIETNPDIHIKVEVVGNAVRRGNPAYSRARKYQWTVPILTIDALVDGQIS